MPMSTDLEQMFLLRPEGNNFSMVSVKETPTLKMFYLLTHCEFPRYNKAGVRTSSKHVGRLIRKHGDNSQVIIEVKARSKENAIKNLLKELKRRLNIRVKTEG